MCIFKNLNSISWLGVYFYIILGISSLVTIFSSKEKEFVGSVSKKSYCINNLTYDNN